MPEAHRNFSLYPAIYIFCDVLPLFVVLTQQKIAIGATGSSFSIRVPGKAWVIKRCTTALLVTHYIWPATTLSSSIFQIADRMTNNSIDCMILSCNLASHVFMTSTTVFMAASAIWYFHCFLEFIRAWSFIGFNSVTRT